MKKQLIGLAVAVALVAGTSPMAFATGNTNGNNNGNSNGNSNGNTNNTSNNTTNNGSSMASASASSNGNSSGSHNNNGNSSFNLSKSESNTQSSSNSSTVGNVSLSKTVGVSKTLNMTLEKAVSRTDLSATTSHNGVSYNNHSRSSQQNNFNSAFAAVNGITNASQNSGNMSNVQQSVSVSISGGSTIH